MKPFNIFQPVLILAAAVLLTSCSNPEGDFKKAEQTNTEQAFNEFIQKHPDSPLVAQAKARIEKNAYEEARKIATVSAYEGFLNRFPKSTLAKQAESDLENAEYEQAKQVGTVFAYEAFLKRFRNSDHSKKARSELEAIEFDLIAKQPSIPGWQAFSKKYPQGQYAAQAIASYQEAVDRELEASLRENVLAYFGSTNSGTNVGLTISYFEDAKFTKLLHNMLLGRGGAFSVFNGQSIVEKGSPITVTMSAPEITFKEMLTITGVANGRGGFGTIDKIIVTEGAIVVTQNGNQFVFKKGHWTNTPSRPEK